MLIYMALFYLYFYRVLGEPSKNKNYQILDIVQTNFLSKKGMDMF